MLPTYFMSILYQTLYASRRCVTSPFWHYCYGEQDYYRRLRHYFASLFIRRLLTMPIDATSVSIWNLTHEDNTAANRRPARCVRRRAVIEQHISASLERLHYITRFLGLPWRPRVRVRWLRLRWSILMLIVMPRFQASVQDAEIRRYWAPKLIWSSRAKRAHSGTGDDDFSAARSVEMPTADVSYFSAAW